MNIPNSTNKDVIYKINRSCREGDNLCLALALLLEDSEGLCNKKYRSIRTVLNCIKDRFKNVKSELDYLEYISTE